MAWDAYPQLDGDWRKVVGLSMTHDIYRSMKGGLPFMLMESTPSVTNWQPTPSLKRPGQHRQEMLLAIGHGADTTMYFQWRKSRGAAEKFHGAVVDHEGSDKTRVFQDVAAHGALLKKLDAVVGTTVRPEVALVNDWEARWALGHSQGPRQGQGGWGGPFDKEYVRTVSDHYRPFWKLGISVDVIESLSPFDRYKLVVAPMLFMLKPGVAERLTAFVKAGGTLVLTYLSGIVNETNIVFRGGWPGGGLRALAGVWAEEIDSLGEKPPQRIVASPGNALGLSGAHPVREYCERVHAGGRDRARHLRERLLRRDAGAHRQPPRRRPRLLPRGAPGRGRLPRRPHARPGAGARAPAQPRRRAAGGRHGPEARGRRAHVPVPAQHDGGRKAAGSRRASGSST